MRLRLAPAALAALAVLAAACGAQCPDEATLRAQIREEVLAELRRENAERRQRAQERVPLADRIPASDAERLRVDAAGAPSRGAAQPLVTVVTFSDFQCPFCSRAAPTVERLLREHPDTVRLVFRQNPLPFHDHAMPAAEAALEVWEQGGDEMFWRYHDLLFANQRALTRADLERYAAQVGADPRGVADALDAHRHRPRIRADQDMAVRLDTRGTPAFFINGRKLMGAQPYEEFEAIVREELDLARRALERGVPRARYYALLMEHAADAPPAEAEPPAPRRARPDPDRVYRLAEPTRAPSRGDASAPVTIQIFSDFQCPFCNRVRPTLERIAQDYGHRVRFVFRHYPLPFHRQAMPAAEAAHEAFLQGGDRAFWELHDLLFDHQRELSTERIVQLAGRVSGIDAARVREALNDHRHRDAIEADMEAIQDAGARIGTPSFFINGRLVQGAQPFSVFEAAIDRALDEAGSSGP
jgi:protein-disulfide isomerase